MIGAGASGSLLGLLGAWGVELAFGWPHDRPENFADPADAAISRSSRKKNLLAVVLNSGFAMLLSLVPMVDWAAHAGGLLGGAMLALVLFAPTLAELSGLGGKLCAMLMGVVGAGLCLAFFVGGIVYFYSGEIDPCPGAKDGNYKSFMPPDCN